MKGHHGVPGANPEGKVLDVVCGMWIDPQTAPAHYEYKGRVYYFCAPGCMHLFREDPERYLAKVAIDVRDASDTNAPSHEPGHGHGHKHGHGHGHGSHGGCCGHA